MARPISDAHRRISAGFIGAYIGKRNQCLRDVVLWMLAGPDSTRSGLLRVHAGALADDLGHSKPAVIDALTRLHNDGHIVWDADNRTALCWFVIRNVTLPYETNRKSYLTECGVFSDSLPRREAIKWIQAIEITAGKGALSKVQSRYLSAPPSTSLSGAEQRTENREQRTESSSVPKGTDTPAVASMSPWALPSEPQADEGPAIDWLKVQEDAQTSRADFRPKSKLLPHLQHKLAVNDAKAKGILPSEPPQLAMDLPAGKPVRKELTPAQQDAIFAKRKMLEVVNHWNEVMAGKNAPCVPKTVMAMAGTLMANFAKFQHREPLEDARWLFDWAMAVDPYHSGRQGKPWTLQAWLTADHLSAVFAAYRAHKGDAKMLTMDIDRTLRDWRLAVETAELNNKIAAANNEF